MPVVNLSNECDAKLKHLAGQDPFVIVSREILIEKLADEEIARAKLKSRTNVDTASELLKESYEARRKDITPLNPDRPGPLEHTVVVSAEIGSTRVSRPKWNSLHCELHKLARQLLGSFDALKAATRANLKAGKHDDEGYKPLPGTDFSIQGVSAAKAWEHSLHLARTIGVPLKLVIEWRNKKGAAHPGKKGTLVSEGK